MKMVLVTGATGNVGAEVVQGLVNRTDTRVLAGVRDPERARAKSPQGAAGVRSHYMRFDFQDPATFSVFNGVDALFLVRPPALANAQRDIAPTIAAAQQAGVGHVVFLSLMGVEDNKVVPHYKIEQLLMASSMTWTFLRAGFFMQNLNTTHQEEIRQRDEIFVPVGDAKTSFIDVRDIAAVAVKALTETGHQNTAYTLTGGEALTYQQVATILSGVLGRQIRYANPSVLRFFWSKVRSGEKLMYAMVVTLLYTMTRRGSAEEVSPDVEQVLGRPPIRFEQYAQDYAASWQR